MAAFEITQTESESESSKEHLKVKIHQKEIIRPIAGPPCSCSLRSGQSWNQDSNENVYVDNGHEKVYVNNGKPIIVTGKSRHVVIPANQPIVVRPSPVVIRQKADVEVRPIHITKQKAPIIVTKKIVKLHQPIIKKYYVEKYRRQESGVPVSIISQKSYKKTCDCPTSSHVVGSK